MIDIDAALFDVAEHLDHPRGETLATDVRTRIAGDGAGARMPTARGPRRVRVLLAIAAAVVVIAGALVAIAPARSAIADWLGIGGVEIRHGAQPLPNATGTDTVPGAPGPVAPTAAVERELAAARRRVGFPLTTPPEAVAAPLLGVAVDTRVPGGLVVLRYRGFTLVEIASAGDHPVIGKLLDPGASAVSTRVSGADALWITGAHQIGYLDRAGNFRMDTIRRAGPVLLWQRAGVTLRIEGLDRAHAEALARSLR